MNRFIVMLAIAMLPHDGLWATDPEVKISRGHNLLQETASRAAVEPGSTMGPLAFKDVTGQAIYLADQLEQGPVVFVFLSTKCPLAKRYTQRLNRLHQEYADQQVAIVAVFPNSDETDAGIKQYAEDGKFSFPVVRDIGGYLTNQLGATMTPQALVIDQDSTLRYRGAIDDNRYANRVRQEYLVNAVEQILSGDEVVDANTQALGCSIHIGDSEASTGEITYSRHIARILQDNCQNCHRSGQVAPFALTNYEEAKRWMTEIQAYTESRLMPPWKAAPNFGEFKNDISLSSAEIALIGRWVQQGAPLGDASELPPEPKFNDDWAFGEPDLIVEMPEEYVIGPEGEDDYRHFIIPFESSKHQFVRAVDVRPGNRNVVHHVLAYVDTSGEARKLDAEDEGPGYTRFGDVGFKPASLIGGWAPGSMPIPTPEGTGRWLPKKCDIVLQVHYYRTGIEETDRTKLGVYFSDAPRPVPTRLKLAINKDFTLEAGDPNCPVKAETVLEEPSYLFSIAPHMHLLGRTMQVTAHLPDETELPLVKIDDWDFNWQTSYRFRSLLQLPAGTKIKLVATFDNSKDNPNNPNHPIQDVGWGEKTTDEMCIAFLGLIHQSEYDPATKSRRPETGRVAGRD